MVDLAYDVAMQQLSGTQDDVNLVIMHPGYAAQHRILERYLSEPSTAYVRFEGFQLSSEQLQEQLDSALIVQTDDGILPGLETLILDECDRADPAELDHF